MSFRQFLLKKLSLFFMLTTLIAAAVAVIGTVYDPEASLGYDALLAPMRYAACCVLPTFVTWSRRELKPRQLLVRMAIEFLLIEAVILGLAFSSSAIDTGRASVVLTIAGSVLVIYVLARLLSWLRDSAEAKRLNEDLLKFQQQHGN